MQNKQLFSRIKVGSHILKNRVVMPAMHTGMCNADGTVSEHMYHYYVERARGGVGLIILEVTAIDYHNSVAAYRQLQLTDTFTIDGMNRLACGVQPYGTKIIAQLHHAGSRALNPEYPIVSSSSRVKSAIGEKVHELTVVEIKDMVQKYASAASNAKKAGLDGVELHASHGYLINEFLSPLVNDRTDEYGGSFENRLRFLLEIIEEIRKRCGKEFLLSVRIPGCDQREGGLTVEDGIQIAKEIEKAGVDMINISTGLSTPLKGNIETQDKPDGNRIQLAEKISPHVNIPTVIVGKIRTLEMCEDIISSKTASMVCIGRQLICDPYWPKKVQENREDEIRKCLSCSECYTLQGLSCACNPYVGQEGTYSENNLNIVKEPKNIVVVGGGVAGMQSAVTASQRGHHVTLIEKQSTLGGQVNIASIPPHKELLNNLTNYLINELKKEAVEIILNRNADALFIQSLNADNVIIATGSVPFKPPIIGIENTVNAWEVLGETIPIPKNKKIIVIGGGSVGCETALWLAEYENDITVIEMSGKLASTQQSNHRVRDLHCMEEKKIKTLTNAVVQKICGKTVYFSDSEGANREEKAELIVCATGQKPVGDTLSNELWELGISNVTAGDAQKVANIKSGIISGFIRGYYV